MSKKTGFEHVRQFHETFGHPIHAQPHVPDTKMIKLRLALILEEFIELSEACLNKEQEGSKNYLQQLKQAESQLHQLTKSDIDVDVVEVADALTDINYVTYGAGHCFGVNLDACMQEVQRSNMSKLGEDGKPIYNENGKIMKGPNYSRPDLKSVLAAQPESA
jgi:predicted HAD superfamily Cof-like phosphohydrolase